MSQEGIIYNPSQGAAQEILTDRVQYYANQAGVGYAKFDVLATQTRLKNGVTQGVLWFNLTQRTQLGAAPTPAHISDIPVNRLIDLGNPFVLSVPDTVGGLAPTPAQLNGANYLVFQVPETETNNLNFSDTPTPPTVGVSTDGKRLIPSGRSETISGDDVTNLKFIAETAATNVRVRCTPMYRLNEY